SPLEVIDRAINTYGFEAIQLHGDESPAYCRVLADRGVEIIKAFGLNDAFDWNTLVPYEEAVDYYLFDTKSAAYGGTGRTFDWGILETNPSDKPYFLSGGLSDENINEALRLKDGRLYGLDLNSQFEKEPGFKDIERLRKTFQLIGTLANTTPTKTDTTATAVVPIFPKCSTQTWKS